MAPALNRQKHEKVSEDRFSNTIWALETIVAKYVSAAIPVLFLTVGLDYFKRGNRKAVMKLSRGASALHERTGDRSRGITPLATLLLKCR